ncbi:MAG TPA: SBBP repeat-containing protein [Terriglobales bacterium]|nr:SBBP repeat-containing protein [Terriglobales bacterium]
MRLNRHQSGKTCSQSRVLIAVAFLIVLGALVLSLAPSAAKSQVAKTADSSRLFASQSSLNASSTQDRQRALSAYSHLPLIFEPNQGQSDAKVKFLARGRGYGLFLTDQEAVLGLQHFAADSRPSSVRNSVVSMKLSGASSIGDPVGEAPLPGKSNYLIGNDPAKWHRDIPQFARVRYGNVYPGIDLVYYGNQGQLEYDFEVSPGRDPKFVALKFSGPRNLTIDSNGDLILALDGSDVRLQAPRVYQKFGAEERSVAGRFELHDRAKGEVGFELGPYDRTRTLIIDPKLAYSTYLGGSGAESCSAITNLAFTPGCPAIAVDAASNAYVAGATESADFPQTAGEYQPTLGAGATANAFIAKFNSIGQLVFATYLGGSGIDYTAGIAVDSGFDIVVAGTTNSGNFPTNGSNGAFQATPVTGGQHVFVSKLDPTGRTLLYSTYLSGNGVDIASGIALDPGGNAYVTGTTTSTESQTGFPSTVGAYQVSSKSTNQFFFTKVDPNASGSGSVPYSTYIGGSSPSSGSVAGGGIAVDGNSNAYITGGTNFTDMPLLNAYQATNKGGFDAFVVKINPTGVTGTQLLYATYLGGSGDDVGYGMAVDSGGDAYVTGSTTSIDFNVTGTTTTTALQPTNHGGTDAFVAKLGIPCVGTSCTTFDVPLNYFTYLGGSGTDIGTAITVDNTGGARITGLTNSADFPIVGSAVQTTYQGGNSDAFFARVDTLATCSPIGNPACVATSVTSYLGGNGTDIGTGVAVDQQGSSYITGETASTNFPVLNPDRGNLDGPSDAFVSKLAPVLNLTMPTPNAVPLVVGVGSQVSFAYTVTNSGEFTNGVTFTDFLPASGASFVSATASPGTCGSPTNNTVLCNIGTLNAGATATVTVIVTPVPPTLPGGTVSLGNSASAFVGQSLLATASASVTVNDFTLSVAPATTAVPAGVPAVFTATVTPSSTSGFPDSVAISCGSGLPTGTTCVPGNNNPIPNLNTGAQSSQVIINTTARVTTTTDLRHGSGMGIPLYATWLPVSGLALLGAGLRGKFSRKRRWLIGLLTGIMLAFILLLSGCHTAATVTTTTGTPAGTYAVTVNAVSGNATRTTLLTLVVQ